MIELPPGANIEELAQYGRPGRPINKRSPFLIGFIGTLGVGLAYALLQAIISVRGVLILILMAGFLAVGLEPAVAFLIRRRFRRSLAVAVVLGGLVLLFGGFVATAVPAITSQGRTLVNALPADLEKLRSNKTFASLDNRYHIVANAQKKVKEGPALGLKAFGGVLGFGKVLLGVAISTLTVLTLAGYFLANLPSMREVGLRLVPASRRDRVGLIADEVLTRVGGYVLGNLATSLVAAVASFIFMIIAGIPSAVALAVIIAITDLIPLVGATLGAAIVTLVALFVSVPTALASIVFFTVYQHFENFVLAPRVMKATVNVSPVATIVAGLVGGSLFGIIGALLAIPIAAAVQLVVAEVVNPRQDAS